MELLMVSNERLTEGIKIIMVKVWDLPDHVTEAEIQKYAVELLRRVHAGDARIVLDLYARDVQVNWLRLPETQDYREVVDWSLALVRNSGSVS